MLSLGATEAPTAFFIPTLTLRMVMPPPRIDQAQASMGMMAHVIKNS